MNNSELMLIIIFCLSFIAWLLVYCLRLKKAVNILKEKIKYKNQEIMQLADFTIQKGYGLEVINLSKTVSSSGKYFATNYLPKEKNTLVELSLIDLIILETSIEKYFDNQPLETPPITAICLKELYEKLEIARGLTK